jgi:Fur family iron response transcriptional regulator
MDALPASSDVDDAPACMPVDDLAPELGCDEICADCSGAAVRPLLIGTGLRPTRRRVLLAGLLFAGADRHVTAQMLHGEALALDMQMSLATVYNTLNQFTQVGLLRRIGPDGSRSFFDTNTTPHPHYYLLGEDILLDVPASELAFGNMPAPMPGHEISCVDVIIHLRRKPA